MGIEITTKVKEKFESLKLMERIPYNGNWNVMRDNLFPISITVNGKNPL